MFVSRLRVWKSLTCLPNYDKDIQGRVLVDLMNEPDGVDVFWGGSDAHPPLEDYYLGTMDAINKDSPGQALFMIEVRTCLAVSTLPSCVRLSTL